MIELNANIIDEPKPKLVSKSDKDTLRRCIVSRRNMYKYEMIRFAIDPKGFVVPDIGCRLPGRGVWLEASLKAVKAAVDQNLFSYSARCSAKIPSDLAENIEKKLFERTGGWIGLAKRAGFLVTGHDKVRAQINLGDLAVLIQASDGSLLARKRLSACAKDFPCVEVFTSKELSNVTGRINVIHGALLKSDFVTPFLADVRRLSGFRSNQVPETEIRKLGRNV
jgi:predicted RNA-binding protein YlxR (DUF448 family)